MILMYKNTNLQDRRKRYAMDVILLLLGPTIILP